MTLSRLTTRMATSMEMRSSNKQPLFLKVFSANPIKLFVMVAMSSLFCFLAPTTKLLNELRKTCSLQSQQGENSPCTFPSALRSFKHLIRVKIGLLEPTRLSTKPRVREKTARSSKLLTTSKSSSDRYYSSTISPSYVKF